MIRPARSQDGFTLLETVCVVAIVAMLAAILLPRLPRETSRPRLEAYAVETASLLNADRTAAIRRRVAVATQIDATSRSIRSGSSGRIVQFPDDVAIDAVLPQRCNDKQQNHKGLATDLGSSRLPGPPKLDRLNRRRHQRSLCNRYRAGGLRHRRRR